MNRFSFVQLVGSSLFISQEPIKRIWAMGMDVSPKFTLETPMPWGTRTYHPTNVKGIINALQEISIWNPEFAWLNGRWNINLAHESSRDALEKEICNPKFSNLIIPAIRVRDSVSVNHLIIKRV